MARLAERVGSEHDRTTQRLDGLAERVGDAQARTDARLDVLAEGVEATPTALAAGFDGLVERVGDAQARTDARLDVLAEGVDATPTALAARFDALDEQVRRSGEALTERLLASFDDAVAGQRDEHAARLDAADTQLRETLDGVLARAEQHDATLSDELTGRVGAVAFAVDRAVEELRDGQSRLDGRMGQLDDVAATVVELRDVGADRGRRGPHRPHRVRGGARRRAARGPGPAA